MGIGRIVIGSLLSSFESCLRPLWDAGADM